MIRLLTLTTLAALFIALPAHALDTKRKEVRTLIDELSREQGFSKPELRALFKDAQTKQAIIDAMSRPAEKVTPWYEYRERFLTQRRILKGADFWQAHEPTLERLADQGMAPAIVVGILGVETMFGEFTGKYRVIDALSTLAFDYPPRSDYFLNELKQFLLLTREESLDPRKAIGSYAGAMGAPQFMPRSYREFAVDGDGDGKRNLWGSWDDVIASVANYLKAHGWRENEPVLAPATLPGDDVTKFDTATIALNESVSSLRNKGVQFTTTLPDDAPAMLVIGQGKNGPEYRVGFNNFYVITRYNRSTMYAMAVHDVGQAIANFTTDVAR